MTVVVADTSPLNYLIQIDEVHLIERLYGMVAIPEEVLEELSPSRGSAYGCKMDSTTAGLAEVHSVRASQAAPALAELDPGERAAIQLAHQAETQSLLLIDDANGRNEADRLGLPNIGTLGVLRLAGFRESC